MHRCMYQKGLLISIRLQCDGRNLHLSKKEMEVAVLKQSQANAKSQRLVIRMGN